MKRLKLIVGIIIFILILSFMGIFLIKQANHTMEDYINNSIAYLEQKNYDAAQGEIEKALEYWDKTDGILTMYIKHENVNDITRQLHSAKENLILEIYDDAYLTLKDLLFILDQIYQNELPLIGNIF